MDFIFDAGTRTLSIDTSNVNPWGADLRAIILRYGQRVPLRGVQMNLTVSADGEEVFSLSLPPEGALYHQTDQDVIATDRVLWSPDQTVVASAWLLTTTGDELTAEATFTSPRPEQPYPSWTWEGGEWAAPEPYPDDGEEYVWDETSNTWIAP